MRRRLRWSGVAALVLMGLSCRGRGAHPPVVNEDYRFQLAWPGQGWTLLEGREARAVVPDAVAAARGLKSVHGAIIVEKLEVPDLEAMAREIAGQTAVRDRKVSPFETLDFAGQKAVRWRTTGTMNAMPVQFEHTIFAHQQHLYQVLAFSGGDLASADGSDFRPFTQAFSLLPGQVRDRVETVKVSDVAGIGWRVRGGVYESASYGLRAVPREGWHVTVGTELVRMNASAEVGLTRAGPEAHLVVLAERAPPEDERTAYTDGLIERTIRAMGAKREGEPMTIKVAGTPVPMVEYSTGGAIPVRYLHGVLFHGRDAFQLLGWSLDSEGASGHAAVVEGLGGFEFLDDPSRTALRQQLAGQLDPRAQVGPMFSLRRDVYRDFGRGFSFRRAGLWRVDAGDEARHHDTSAILWLTEPALGLFATVSTEPTTADSLTAHRRETADRLAQPKGPMLAHVGGAPALRSSGIVQGTAIRTQWEVTTLVRDGQLVTINVWGLPADMAAAREAIDQMLAAFHFGGPALEPPGTRERRYRDQRLGFSFQPPAGEWSSQDITPAGVAAQMKLVGWKNGTREIMVGGLATNGRAPGAALQGMEERLASMGGKVEREEATLGGLHWQRSRARKGLTQTDMYLVERDGIAYLIMLTAPFVGQDEFFAQAPAGFSFLD
jgi:hypothetical protein